MRDSWDALRAGYLTLLPCTDSLGRPVVYTVGCNLTREYFGLGQVSFVYGHRSYYVVYGYYPGLRLAFRFEFGGTFSTYSWKIKL